MSTTAPEKRDGLETAAKSFALRGWLVFPAHFLHGGRCSCGHQECDSPAKHPLTGNGLHEATTSSAQISKWWQKVPNANVAVRTRPESGIWVLDVDGPAGLAALAQLEHHLGALPRTPTVKTGGGGRHYYFRYAAGRSVNNATRIAGLALDVRGGGGFVLAPPSNHSSGTHYQWDVSPTYAAVADAPPWLLDLVTSKRLPTAFQVQQPQAGSVAVLHPNPEHHASRHATCTDGSAVSSAQETTAGPAPNGRVLRVGDGLDLATDPGAGEGCRHNRALQLVGADLGRGDDPTAVEDLALAWAGRCMPPMAQEEMRRIVDDLARKHQAQPAQPALPSWEPPLPLDSHTLPCFPVDALPDWQRALVAAEAAATQTPPDLAGLLVLAATAAACARKIEVQVMPGYREPVNLYVVVALPPANRKSAVYSDVTAPITSFEAEEVLRLTPEIAEATARAKMQEAQLEKLQRQALNAKPEERETAAQGATKFAREMASTVIQTLPRLVATDTTPERLAGLLAENSGRMAVLSPEGDVFDLMAGRYGNKAAPNFDIFLNSHSGDDLRVDRVGRPSQYVRRPALTLGLTVQPDVIRGLADKPGFRGRGLLGRFLYNGPTKCQLLKTAADMLTKMDSLARRLLSWRTTGPRPRLSTS